MMNVNYKILTKILMQRFIKTFDFAIESHQSTYIFEKFIDDNVRIIQTIIAKYRNTLQNVIIVFFDQKKIFDRVNHEFLWAILKRFDISAQFIFWVKFLYVDVKIIIYINDHQSRRMTIKCEIKQNDFLNCSLFVIVIEILICYILQNTRISEIMIKSLTIKFTMFVDDTTVILKNQKEINVLIEILELYERTSRTKMNWHKSFLLLIDQTFQIIINEMKYVNLEKFYEHLNISIDTDTTRQMKIFWENMFQKFKNIMNSWFKFYFFFKRKIMIANNFMLFIFRYAINFLKLIVSVKQNLNKKYYNLVWNHKKKNVVKNLHACMHKMNEKINCLDLEIIVNASIINLISKTEFHSQLSWVQIVKKFLIQRANLTKFQTSIKNSWFQWFFKTMMLSIEFRYAWIKWKRLYKFKKNDQIVWFMFSISKYDVFCIYMWYHLLIKIISDDVARKWTSQIWIVLWNNDVKFLTNVWNSNLKK